jgi:hypothetical protein
METFGDSVDVKALEEIIDSNSLRDFHFSIEELKNKLRLRDLEGSSEKAKQFRLVEDEKIYIQNAGLILISIFFPALFKELRWVAEGMFINKELQFKAIFLLHYLSTGETAAPEYTLQLNKILCGLNLNEPIPFSLELTDQEKKEADLLLTDVLTHWSVLQNSSVEGLQGSFILRDGLLSYKDDHWQLQVERKGYDILLDRIPWSWKMIKLEWMDTYIDIEW